MNNILWVKCHGGIKRDNGYCAYFSGDYSSFYVGFRHHTMGKTQRIRVFNLKRYKKCPDLPYVKRYWVTV